jgi:hypothetical protein
MKMIYVLKLYVVLTCIINKPGNYDYSVYNVKNKKDISTIHSNTHYNEGDTISVMGFYDPNTDKETILGVLPDIKPNNHK